MPRLDDILDPLAKGLTGTVPEPVPEPAPEPDPKIILDHIAEVSKNARATWFGLLGLLAFVGVTLLAHNDADFFAYGAETQLPLVGIKVPVKAFFIFAPLFVAALYAYLHLYLMTLYDGLADAPAQIDGQPLADRVFPWLISHAALWYRNRRRDDGCAAPRVLGELVVAVSFLLGSVFGVAVLALLWSRSMPAHDEWLTLWIGLCFWFAALVGLTSFLTARARLAGATREKVVRTRWGRRVVGGIAFVILACLSWLRTEGGFENYADWIERNGEWVGSSQPATWLNANLPTTKAIAGRTDLRWFRLYPADLVEAELTRKPPGWLPFDIWLDEFEAKYRARPGKIKTDLRADRTFIAEATQRYNAPLSPPDLQDADLRNANMFRAFLPGADLRRAEMQGAFLYKAQMQGADLRGAEMQGAVLYKAEMQGADLRDAKMQGADLYKVQMQGAELFAAQMQGAELYKAQMQGAELFAAQMQGADLRGANMQGADLRDAKMQGAFLRDAKMQNADCSSATLRGALLQSADVTCRNLTQAQLEDAVGDPRTVLPRGLTVASCLETLPEDVEAALAHHPEEGDRFRASRAPVRSSRAQVRISRAQVRDALLCDRDKDGDLIEQPGRVGRSESQE